MPSLQIRNLPEPLYRELAKRAKQERRSIAQQATVILEETLNPRSHRLRRQAILKQLGDNPLIRNVRSLPPAERLIRQDRDR